MWRAFCLLLLLTSGCAFAENVANSDETIKQLFDQARWSEVASAVEKTSVRSADLDYYYGSALAQLGKWDQARNAFLTGWQLEPNDKRFPIELAGLAFRQKNYLLATRYLRRGLHLDPHDEYANNFLATIYFLQGNLPAALKYWNRAGKPRIENVGFDPAPRIHAGLLDRAFAFAPGSTLALPDLLTSETRVQALGVFPVFDFKLAARDDGNFDVGFNAQERNGFGEAGERGYMVEDR